jgi:hypothetical protein
MVGRNADGSGGMQTLGNGFLPNISQNGKYVTYLVNDRLRYSEVLPDGSLGPATGVLKSTPEPLVLAAALSPDGNFVAYAERQPDRGLDVFMTKFPSGDGRWQISRGGGRAPVWARAGAELLFVAGGPGGPNQMMAVSVSPGSETVIGTQLKLFDIDAAMDLSPVTANYAVTADGKQFVMIRMLRPAGTQVTPRWIFVQNWKVESRPDR